MFPGKPHRKHKTVKYLFILCRGQKMIYCGLAFHLECKQQMGRGKKGIEKAKDSILVKPQRYGGVL